MKTKVFKLVLFVICLFTVTNIYAQEQNQSKFEPQVRYFFSEYGYDFKEKLYNHLWLINPNGGNIGYYVLLHDTKNKYVYKLDHMVNQLGTRTLLDDFIDSETSNDLKDRDKYTSAFDNPENKNLFTYGIYKQEKYSFKFYTSPQKASENNYIDKNGKLSCRIDDLSYYLTEITENNIDELLWINGIFDIENNPFITKQKSEQLANKYKSIIDSEYISKKQLEEQYKQDSIQTAEAEKWRNYVEPYTPEQEQQNHLSKTDAEIINKPFIDAKNLWTNKTEAYFVADVPNQGLRFDISKHFLFHGNKVVLHTEWKQLVKGTWYSYSKNSVLRGTWKKIAPNKIVITFKNGKKLTCTYRKTKDQYMHNKLIISGIGTAIEGYPSVNRRRTDLWDNHDTLLSEYFGISY